MSRNNLETTGNESEATKQYVSCGAVYHAIRDLNSRVCCYDPAT